MANVIPTASAGSAVEPFLILTDLSKSYAGVQALCGFSMSVSRGEVIGIVGENGAGKSTAEPSRPMGLITRRYRLRRVSRPVSPSCTRNSIFSTISMSPGMSILDVSRARAAGFSWSTGSDSTP